MSNNTSTTTSASCRSKCKRIYKWMTTITTSSSSSSSSDDSNHEECKNTDKCDTMLTTQRTFVPLTKCDTSTSNVKWSVPARPSLFINIINTDDDDVNTDVVPPMRLAFCGKIASGKTYWTSLVLQWCVANKHCGRRIGFGDAVKEVARDVFGRDQRKKKNRELLTSRLELLPGNKGSLVLNLKYDWSVPVVPSCISKPAPA